MPSPEVLQAAPPLLSNIHPFAKSFGINLRGSNSAFSPVELINIWAGVWICLGVFWMRSGRRGFQLLSVGEHKKAADKAHTRRRARTHARTHSCRMMSLFHPVKSTPINIPVIPTPNYSPPPQEQRGHLSQTVLIFP